MINGLNEIYFGVNSNWSNEFYPSSGGEKGRGLSELPFIVDRGYDLLELVEEDGKAEGGDLENRSY